MPGSIPGSPTISIKLLILLQLSRYIAAQDARFRYI